MLIKHRVWMNCRATNKRIYARGVKLVFLKGCWKRTLDSHWFDSQFRFQGGGTIGARPSCKWIAVSREGGLCIHLDSLYIPYWNPSVTDPVKPYREWFNSSDYLTSAIPGEKSTSFPGFGVKFASTRLFFSYPVTFYHVFYNMTSMLFIIVKKEAKNIKHYYHCEKENTKGTGNQCRIKKCKSFSSLVFIQVKCFFYGKYPTKKSRKTQWKINQPSDVFFENPVIRSWRYRFHWVCYRGVFISRACLSRARLFNAVIFFFPRWDLVCRPRVPSEDRGNWG